MLCALNYNNNKSVRCPNPLLKLLFTSLINAYCGTTFLEKAIPLAEQQLS